MSGEVKQNTSVATGIIATAPSATESASDPALDTNPESVGAEWHNTTSGQIFICWDNTAGLNKWKGQKGGVVQTTRGVFWTGTQSAPDTMTTVLDYITIDTLGDATDFGDLSASDAERRNGNACSNGIEGRGVFGGGMTGHPGPTLHNEIFYIAISTPGDGVDFGDLTQARSQCSSTSSASNDRGVWFGGYTGSATTDRIDYVTISNLGNATDFGNTSPAATQDTSACSNGTYERGICVGGNRTSLSNVIDYITISSPGNATDFGNILTAASYTASCDNRTNDRGVSSGGYTGAHQDVIQYITISTPGNSADFGDLLQPWYGASGVSNGTSERGMYGGGYPNTGGVNSKVIQYITINSLGDSADFGDLTVERSSMGACSDAG